MAELKGKDNNMTDFTIEFSGLPFSVGSLQCITKEPNDQESQPVEMIAEDHTGEMKFTMNNLEKWKELIKENNE